MSTCPNNVWNHTDGCACVANGSVTAECPEVNLDGQQVITLPAEYTPSSTPVADTTRHITDLGNGKVVVTYVSEENYGPVDNPGEKMDSVRDLLRAHSGAEAVFPPDEYTVDALADHLRGEPLIVADRVAFIRFEDGKAIAEQHTGIYSPDHFRDLASRYEAAVVVDSDEMHRHTIGGDPQFRSDFSQISNEINDYAGATYTVNHDVVDLASGQVLATDTDDHDGSITTVGDGEAYALSAHWDIPNTVDDFYDADEDSDDEFDDWGHPEDDA